MITEVPDYILFGTDHDFMTYFQENYMSFSTILVDAFRDWEKFAVSLKRPLSIDDLRATRFGFFTGYQICFNRTIQELTEGINHNESLPFQPQVVI